MAALLSPQTPGCQWCRHEEAKLNESACRTAAGLSQVSPSCLSQALSHQCHPALCCFPGSKGCSGIPTETPLSFGLQIFSPIWLPAGNKLCLAACQCSASLILASRCMPRCQVLPRRPAEQRQRLLVPSEASFVAEDRYCVCLPQLMSGRRHVGRG